MTGFEKSLETFRPFHPVETATIFGGLLTVPELQPNCVRLEGLTHIALAYCRGTKKPCSAEVSRWYAEFGASWLGQMEDLAYRRLADRDAGAFDRPDTLTSSRNQRCAGSVSVRECHCIDTS